MGICFWGLQGDPAVARAASAPRGRSQKVWSVSEMAVKRKDTVVATGSSGIAGLFPRNRNVGGAQRGE